MIARRSCAERQSEEGQVVKLEQSVLFVESASTNGRGDGDFFKERATDTELVKKPDEKFIEMLTVHEGTSK